VTGRGGRANPAAGDRFERRTMRVLRAAGWVTQKSPGSHSAVDLMASRAGRTLFVQCKINGRLDPEDWNALLEAAGRAGAIPLLVERLAGKDLPLRWWRLTGPKTVRGSRRPPKVPFTLDEAAG
jgi:Holliday junction resolvase